MAKCIYPRCYSCMLENCIKDIQAPKKERKKKTEQHIRKITIKKQGKS